MKNYGFLSLILCFALFGTACEKDRLRQIDKCCEDSGLRLEATDGRYFHINSAFTPNGDGINDLMAVFSNAGAEIQDFDLRIQGLGLTLFETKQPDDFWTGAINVGSANLSNQNGPLAVVKAGDYKVFVRVELIDGTILEEEGTICVYQTCEQGNRSESLPANCTFPDQFDISIGQNAFPTNETACQ